MDTFALFLKNISALASLISALMAASVSILILCLNQIFARRQQRTQILQLKLEELYIDLNLVGERNTRLFKLLVSSIHGNYEAKKKLDEMDEIELYGYLSAKKMIMIVRLYFPKLAKIHQNLFSAEQELNRVLWGLWDGSPPELKEIIDASGRVGHLLRLMEHEMVANQRLLLQSSVFPRRYKPVSKEQIMDVPPPPEGPPLAKMKSGNKNPD